MGINLLENYNNNNNQIVVPIRKRKEFLIAKILIIFENKYLIFLHFTKNIWIFMNPYVQKPLFRSNYEKARLSSQKQTKKIDKTMFKKSKQFKI